MNKFFIGFIVFWLGVMGGYRWQHYHHSLRISELQREIADNRQLVNSLLATEDLLLQKLDEIQKAVKGKKAFELEVKTTGYCNHPICINDERWQDGMTAIGTIARPGVCAADWSVIPVGAVLYVEGYGFCTVEDRGGKVRGNHIDLFFNTYTEAKAWGMKKKQVKIFL